MLRIALTKGRIANSFYRLMSNTELDISKLDLNSRKLVFDLNGEYNIILVKASDVINLVSNDYADIGIVGSDTIEEMCKENIIELFDLNIGICKFVLATTPERRIKDIKVIATKYPNISKRLLAESKLNARIIKMDGSLELAPIINYADAIIDLVETGNTLRENGLITKKEYQQISTKIISRKENKENAEVKKLIRKIEVCNRKEDQ